MIKFARPLVLGVLISVSVFFTLTQQVKAGNGVPCPVGRSCSGVAIQGSSQCELAVDPTAQEGPDYWCCPAGQMVNGLDRTCIPDSTGGEFDATAPVTNQTFNELNPLVQFGDSAVNVELGTPGGIISRALRWIFPLAGIILFVILLWSGFEMILGAQNPKAQEAGSQRAGAALIGFLMLFVSFWVVRLIEILTGAQIF